MKWERLESKEGDDSEVLYRTINGQLYALITPFQKDRPPLLAPVRWDNNNHWLVYDYNRTNYLLTYEDIPFVMENPELYMMEHLL